MSDPKQSDGAAAGAFDSLDPRLTVYALANGMDLAKGPGYRRLEWFTEGLERGIMVEVQQDGTLNVDVLCWKTGTTEGLAIETVSSGIPADQVGTLLDPAIEQANALSP